MTKQNRKNEVILIPELSVPLLVARENHKLCQFVNGTWQNTARGILFACMDLTHIQKVYSSVCNFLFLEGADTLTEKGSHVKTLIRLKTKLDAKKISEDVYYFYLDNIIKNIFASIVLHGATCATFCPHQNCGADLEFMGYSHYDAVEDEAARHMERVKMAVEIITGRIPTCVDAFEKKVKDKKRSPQKKHGQESLKKLRAGLQNFHFLAFLFGYDKEGNIVLDESMGK